MVPGWVRSEDVFAVGADEQVEQLMSSDDTPEYEMEWIAGSDHAAEKQRVQDELDDLPRSRLPRTETLAEMGRLWDELDRLAALPAVSPKRQLRRTGRT